MNEIKDFIVKLIDKVFFTPLGDMRLVDIIAGAVMLAVAVAAVIIIFKLVKWILQKSGTSFRTVFSAKARCQKIQCTSCGRTLDKCICVKNRERGYLGRVMLYNRERRLRNKKLKLQKMQEKNKK